MTKVVRFSKVKCYFAELSQLHPDCRVLFQILASHLFSAPSSNAFDAAKSMSTCDTISSLVNGIAALFTTKNIRRVHVNLLE